jgi:esterase/lipase superfamily enzyme
MNSRHMLLDSPTMGRRVHLWTFGDVGAPLVVFPSNAGVAHEWQKGGMIDAIAPLIAARRVKVYCPETNVSRSFTADGSTAQRMAAHGAYERFVLDTLVPFVHDDCRAPHDTVVTTGCSMGALYASLFVLKHPERFGQALCLSGRYRTSTLFDHANDDVYFNDPLAFVPNLSGAALERVRRRAHIIAVVGRGAHEAGCIRETAEFGAALQKKAIPNHVAFWGHDSAHDYTWWRRQAVHYLAQLFPPRR